MASRFQPTRPRYIPPASGQVGYEPVQPGQDQQEVEGQGRRQIPAEDQNPCGGERGKVNPRVKDDWPGTRIAPHQAQPAEQAERQVKDEAGQGPEPSEEAVFKEGCAVVLEQVDDPIEGPDAIGHRLRRDGVRDGRAKVHGRKHPPRQHDRQKEERLDGRELAGLETAG